LQKVFFMVKEDIFVSQTHYAIPMWRCKFLQRCISRS
jgi:hypothetical protein